MEWFPAPEYWLGRLVFQRALAALYVIAFVSAALQFRALIGERGMTPVPEFVRRVPFRKAPSVFHWRFSDRFFAGWAWAGAALSAAVLAGAADAVPLWVSMVWWAALWAMYLSIVNVGQTWYGFGWETLLLETGALAVFLGNARTAPPVLVLWLLRWLLFRLEFGAGLIKMRGDPCWRDLTCLYYHHETQPMPGPLSWFFHHLPKPVHRVETAANHVAQLGAPVLLFTPQPVATWAALAMIVTQLWLVLSGNFAWLNWLTIVIAVSVVDASAVGLGGLAGPPAHLARPALVRGAGHRRDRGRPRAQLPPGPQPALPPAADEHLLRAAAPGQRVRRLRLHHPGPARGGHRGHGGRGDHRCHRVAGVRVQGQAG